MNEDKNNRWPPENYMEKIGIKCPDYWEDLKTLGFKINWFLVVKYLDLKNWKTEKK